MPAIRSKVQVQSEAFAANARRMRELLAEVQRLRALTYRAVGGGAEEIMLGIICKLEGTLPEAAP